MELRQQRRFEVLTVLMQKYPDHCMTANAFVEDMRKTKEAGMNEHLTKPVDGEKLLQVLYNYKKQGF